MCAETTMVGVPRGARIRTCDRPRPTRCRINPEALGLRAEPKHPGSQLITIAPSSIIRLRSFVTPACHVDSQQLTVTGRQDSRAVRLGHCPVVMRILFVTWQDSQTVSVNQESLQKLNVGRPSAHVSICFEC
jgi:hypothetical protein